MVRSKIRILVRQGSGNGPFKIQTLIVIHLSNKIQFNFENNLTKKLEHELTGFICIASKEI